ncbi:MAG TPA: lysylphosphatidylglycerol synthase transmembrane domain-containing protein [Bryobacteraceae bacterium]|nr:lysylphosphatidylglycerol synthase transmembrane domain-containing protein [Bryobacteraceae bacterium]
MDIVEASSRRRGVPKWLIPAIGYTLSGASLLWVFWKFPFSQLGDHLRTMEWNWVAAAVLLEFAVYFIDAWRWGALLKPVGAPSFGMCLQAVFIGVLANDILPAKAGEVVRCLLLSYETKVPLSLALTSDVILRIMDGLWIPIVYLIITLQVPTHVDVSRGMWVFGAGAVTVGLVLLFALFRRQHAHHLVRTKSWAARFLHLLDEIHRLGNWRELRVAMGISGIYWLMQVLAVWALTRADRFDLGLSAAAFLLIVKAVLTLIPNAPANMGAYQAAVVYAFGFLLVERANAQAFAEIMFGFLTLPIAIGGALAVVSADIDILALHRHARRPHGKSK